MPKNPLETIAIVQQRLATQGRRLAPGFLGGRTEVASPVSSVARGLVAPGSRKSPVFTAEGDEVDTGQTTSSTSFTDLATVGPEVSLSTGARALVGISCSLANNTANQGSYMGFEVSGATTRAVQVAETLTFDPIVSGDIVQAAQVVLIDDLAPGANVFTAKYRVAGGTGTFTYRRIWVLAL